MKLSVPVVEVVVVSIVHAPRNSVSFSGKVLGKPTDDGYRFRFTFRRRFVAALVIDLISIVRFSG